jgi:hypothetical protein
MGNFFQSAAISTRKDPNPQWVSLDKNRNIMPSTTFFSKSTLGFTCFGLPTG